MIYIYWNVCLVYTPFIRIDNWAKTRIIASRAKWWLHAGYYGYTSYFSRPVCSFPCIRPPRVSTLLKADFHIAVDPSLITPLSSLPSWFFLTWCCKCDPKRTLKCVDSAKGTNKRQSYVEWCQRKAMLNL